MKRYLITGMAGTGKSTVATELQAQGIESHDLEAIEGMFAMYKEGTSELFTDFDNADPDKINKAEWRCDPLKLRHLIENQTATVAFYAAVASNMDDILPLFDQIFVLTVSPQSLHGQLSNREGRDKIGNTEASRQVILGWKDWWENEMKQRGAITVDADRPPNQIASHLIQLTTSDK